MEFEVSLYDVEFLGVLVAAGGGVGGRCRETEMNRQREREREREGERERQRETERQRERRSVLQTSSLAF